MDAPSDRHFSECPLPDQFSHAPLSAAQIHGGFGYRVQPLFENRPTTLDRRFTHDIVLCSPCRLPRSVTSSSEKSGLPACSRLGRFPIRYGQSVQELILHSRTRFGSPQQQSKHFARIAFTGVRCFIIGTPFWVFPRYSLGLARNSCSRLRSPQCLQNLSKSLSTSVPWGAGETSSRGGAGRTLVTGWSLGK